MIGSWRVLLKPVSHSAGSDFHFVAGATLSLSRGGPGRSKATSAAQPASLVFTLGLIKSVRPPEDREDQPLATLTGQLLLQPDLTAMFTVGGAGALSDDRPGGETANNDDDGPIKTDVGQTLLLDFDPGTFTASGPLKVKLPAISSDVRHLELQVELQIAGATESAASVNDTLDKPVALTFLVVAPKLCLDTPVDDPAEHNLALRASLHDDDLDVQSLQFAGQDLVEGQQFFQDGKVVYFKPAGKPQDGDQGTLVTQDGRELKFELHVAQNAKERLDSLIAQVKNAAAMADAAAALAQKNGQTADDTDGARFDILAQARNQMFVLLASIESQLDGDRDFGLYQARITALPPLDGEDTAAET
jgi:hypothetical protein